MTAWPVARRMSVEVVRGPPDAPSIKQGGFPDGDCGRARYACSLGELCQRACHAQIISSLVEDLLGFVAVSASPSEAD
jgi:hypothetical protein